MLHFAILILQFAIFPAPASQIGNSQSRPSALSAVLPAVRNLLPPAQVKLDTNPSLTDRLIGQVLIPTDCPAPFQRKFHSLMWVRNSLFALVCLVGFGLVAATLLRRERVRPPQNIGFSHDADFAAAVER